MSDELQTLIGYKDTESNPENIQKTGTMTVAPGLNVGDHTHDSKFCWDTKFTKMNCPDQPLSRFSRSSKKKTARGGQFPYQNNTAFD
jgi:hypothetical protein